MERLAKDLSLLYFTKVMTIDFFQNFHFILLGNTCRLKLVNFDKYSIDTLEILPNESVKWRIFIRPLKLIKSEYCWRHEFVNFRRHIILYEPLKLIIDVEWWAFWLYMCINISQTNDWFELINLLQIFISWSFWLCF